jgi:fucose permease
MAISGGALLPLTYGRLSDLVSPQSAYWLLLPCYAMILWYAASGHKIRNWSAHG